MPGPRFWTLFDDFFETKLHHYVRRKKMFSDLPSIYALKFHKICRHIYEWYIDSFPLLEYLYAAVLDAVLGRVGATLALRVLSSLRMT